MSRKIKFCLFTTLYHCFAFLADKSGGWQMFVKPKILFGSFIIGLGIVACQQPDKKSTNPNKISNEDVSKTDSIIIDCYEIVMPMTKSPDGIYENPDEHPRYLGGWSELLSFIEEKIKWPTELSESNVQGRVICQFIVEKDGSVDSIKVLRGIHPLMDAEAVRVLKLMPKWIPGKHEGEVVRVRFTIPVRFNPSSTKEK